MVFVTSFATDRYNCCAQFPTGTAKEIIADWGAGPALSLTAEQVPHYALLQGNRKTVTDAMTISGSIAICPEARAVIESLEPGIHQFFPIDVVRSRGKLPIYRLDGKVLKTPYYLLNPGIRLDAVDLEKSNVNVQVFPQVTLVTLKSSPSWAGVVLRRCCIAGRHVWRGKSQLFQYTFFSDELVNAFQQYKWKGLEFTSVCEM